MWLQRWNNNNDNKKHKSEACEIIINQGEDTEDILWHLLLPPKDSTGEGGNKTKRQKGSNAKVQEFQASYATQRSF